ncbi:MAG: sulfatase-like hydrolase/transferase, partial [Pseudanabaenales cyanobacterium]|nr:sulfatase-like hydrolase/transferase [Pseudanabaenales cyanobacterium]
MAQDTPKSTFRSITGWIIFVAIAALVLPVASRAAERPNILLIISDDQAWTDYSFMGHPEIRTPRLDRLASESLLFPRGYVPASLCCPSLASIVTGLFPHQHKIVCNDPPYDATMSRREFYQTQTYRDGRETMSRFIESVPTLPRELGKLGYLSFQSGKWWQGSYSRAGFTHG